MKRRAVLLGLAALAAPQAGKAQTQLQKVQSVKRRPVVPMSMIRRYGLEPSDFGLYVMGEDGQPYALDDVLAVMCQILTR